MLKCGMEWKCKTCWKQIWFYGKYGSHIHVRRKHWEIKDEQGTCKGVNRNLNWQILLSINWYQYLLWECSRKVRQVVWRILVWWIWKCLALQYLRFWVLGLSVKVFQFKQFQRWAFSSGFPFYAWHFKEETCGCRWDRTWTWTPPPYSSGTRSTRPCSNTSVLQYLDM